MFIYAQNVKIKHTVKSGCTDYYLSFGKNKENSFIFDDIHWEPPGGQIELF